MVLPGPWQVRATLDDRPADDRLGRSERSPAPPDHVRPDLRLVVAGRADRGDGEIFTSSAGLTLIVRVAPRATRYVLLVFTVVPSTLVASGSSNVPLPFTSMWQVLQLRSSDGKRTSLNSLTELERPMTTNGVSRKPPAWIECTIVLKSMGVSGRRCAGPTPGRW